MAVRQDVTKREEDHAYLSWRKSLAESALELSRRLKDGPPVFHYMPRLDLPVEVKRGASHSRGRLGGGYGTSLYESHYEYPVDGTGLQKDLIFVVEGSETRTPIFEWCRNSGAVVVCTRCGDDITYQINRFGCRWQRMRSRAPLSETQKAALKELTETEQRIARLERRRAPQVADDIERLRARSKRLQESLSK